MEWWRVSDIPDTNDNFYNIIKNFIFKCPSSTRKIHNEKGLQKGKKSTTEYSDVSARNCSFKSRGITGSLLNTILAQIKRPLVKNDTYIVLARTEAIENKVESIITNSSLGDEYFELMVFHKRSEMPDTEAIYYYIRNAFAHGSFGLITDNNGRKIYLLESKSRGVVRAQMRLWEETLMKYIQYMHFDADEVRTLQKKRKNRN